MHPAIKRLRRLCRRWGGNLILLEEDNYQPLFWLSSGSKRDGFHEAPFASWHGLQWQAKLVFAAIEHVQVGPLIHEMGHVFASPSFPCNEYDFLGWEACVARSVRAYPTWSKQNWNYGTDDGPEWGELTRKQQSDLLAERIAVGKRLRIIGPRNQPLAIR